VKRTKFLSILVLGTAGFGAHLGIAGEPTASEPMALDFGRSCVLIATEDELSRPGVIMPRLTPEHPIKATKYLADAGKRGQLLKMEMLLLVNEEGYVSQAKVLTSSGSASFDRTSLEATRDWLLAPGRINGETRCMWFTFHVTWRF
jgi:TonB family protein